MFYADSRTVNVHTGPDRYRTLGVADQLDGGTVLPGFVLALDHFFAELDAEAPEDLVSGL